MAKKRVNIYLDDLAKKKLRDIAYVYSDKHDLSGERLRSKIINAILIEIPVEQAIRMMNNK
jgi:hypothetical protein